MVSNLMWRDVRNGNSSLCDDVTKYIYVTPKKMKWTYAGLVTACYLKQHGLIELVNERVFCSYVILISDYRSVSPAQTNH